MTTEDDFQAALDATPDDWQLRLVFADWLDERGDPRGPGFRALGFLRLNPITPTLCVGWCAGDNESYADRRIWRHCRLAVDWFALTRPLLGCVAARNDRYWIEGMTREEAEYAAAIAFTRLPVERRAELLAAI